MDGGSPSILFSFLKTLNGERSRSIIFSILMVLDERGSAFLFLSCKYWMERGSSIFFLSWKYWMEGGVLQSSFLLQKYWIEVRRSFNTISFHKILYRGVLQSFFSLEMDGRRSLLILCLFKWYLIEGWVLQSFFHENIGCKEKFFNSFFSFLKIFDGGGVFHFFYMKYSFSTLLSILKILNGGLPFFCISKTPTSIRYF